MFAPFLLLVIIVVGYTTWYAANQELDRYYALKAQRKTDKRG